MHSAIAGVYWIMTADQRGDCRTDGMGAPGASPRARTVTRARVDTPGWTVRIVHYPPGRQMAAHAHDIAGVSLVLAGALTEEVSIANVAPGAGSVVVKPAGTVHSNRFGPAGATLLAVTLRPGSDDAMVSEAVRTLDAWRWTADVALARAVLRTVRVLTPAPGLAPAPVLAPRLGMLLVDIVSDLLAAVTGDTQRGRGGAPGLPRWLRSIRARLDASAPDAMGAGVEAAGDLSLAQLASHVRLHPVYVARRFRRAYGCTVTEYRQAARIRRAVDLLVSGARPLSEVAHVAGFADHSHMCREVRAAAGVPPGVLRRLASEGPGARLHSFKR